MVETIGISPCTMWVVSSSTESETRIATRPMPPATGKSRPAVSKPASRQHRAQRAIIARSPRPSRIPHSLEVGKAVGWVIRM